MHAKAVRKVFMVFVALISLGPMLACAGREFAPKDLFMYWYYPKELTDADRAIEAAREAGKDKECPKEFEEAKARVDKAYKEYAASKAPEPIQINIVCPPPPTPTCELQADREIINLGESVTLRLTTSGEVTSAMLEGTSEATKKVSPTSTAVYIAKVVGPGGSNTCSVPVTVKMPPPPACELKADRTKINPGESVTLKLATSGEVTSAMLDETEVAPTGGTKTIEPGSTAKYIAKVVGPGGSNTCSVSLNVGGLPRSSPTPAPSEKNTTQGVKTRNRLGEFPLPPPTPSADYVFEHQVFVKGRQRSVYVTDIAKKIAAALKQAGYHQMRYYVIKGGGFAIATQIEQIFPDGRSMNPPDRWTAGVMPEREWNFGRMLKQFRKDMKGRFRLIVFLVSKPFQPGPPKKMTEQEAREYARNGRTTFPSSRTRLIFSDDYVVQALIYEFAQPLPGKSAGLLLPGQTSLTGIDHLTKANILQLIKGG